VQRNGADVIGMIFTRDGHIRFFSVEKEFKVFVVGNGIEEVSNDVYKISMEEGH